VRFIVTAVRTQSGIAGAILSHGRALAFSPAIETLMQQKAAAVEGMNAFVFHCRHCLDQSAACRLQMVIYSTERTKTSTWRWTKSSRHHAERAVHGHRQRSRFQPADNQVKVDRSKVNELGLTMQSIGDTLALLVGENLCQLVQSRWPILQGNTASSRSIG